MKKYNKGGISRFNKIYALAQSMKNKERLTQRDTEMAKELVKSQSPRQKALDTSKRVMTAIKGAKDFRSAYNRDKAKVQKRMGGGMMQRPMGYKAGTMIKARGGGMARSKPTKMY